MRAEDYERKINYDWPNEVSSKSVTSAEQVSKTNQFCGTGNCSAFYLFMNTENREYIRSIKKKTHQKIVSGSGYILFSKWRNITDMTSIINCIF